MGKREKDRGFAFEREVCRLFSLWWSGGSDDMLLWRTAGSGSCATTRRKGGKATKGQDGDVGAIDPAIAPLIRFWNVECKHGYKASSFHDLLDRPRGHSPPDPWHWMKHSRTCAEASGALFWCVIWRRTRRRILLACPHDAALLIGAGPALATLDGHCLGELGDVAVYSADDFFSNAKPALVCDAVHRADTGTLPDWIRRSTTDHQPEDVSSVH
jgi:hypothetical protein